MIARILVLLLIIIIMPTMYFDWRYWRKQKSFNWLKRVLLWLPTIAMVVYTIVLSTEKDFIPHDTTALYWYLFLLGVWTIPKTLVAICSFLGWLWCRFSKSKRNYGNLLAFFLSIACIFVVIYGSTFGVKKLVVEHQDLYFKDLPKAFDGYKLVHISDLHVALTLAIDKLLGSSHRLCKCTKGRSHCIYRRLAKCSAIRTIRTRKSFAFT